mmetsp:Transcript_18096/g.27986  ORF Transcript_18096/g.27986 Transcript_18096/m.27986 type:complete len:524 (-) Transcript_18096:5060-6631(-)
MCDQPCTPAMPEWPGLQVWVLCARRALHVDDAVIGVEDALVHHLRQGRMREDGVHQVFFGGFQRLAHHIALDQFRDLGPDHVRAQQFAGLGVKHGLDHPLRLAQSDGFAVADEGELADLDGVPRLFGLGLGQPDAGDLWVAIGAPRNRVWLDRMHVVLARDQLGNHDAFVAGLVRQPRRARDIADGIEPLNTRTAEFIRDHMGPVDLHAKRLKAKVLGVAHDADSGNDRVKLLLFDLAAHFDMGGHFAFGAVKLLDHRLLHDFHALLLEGLFGKGADLCIFHRQDTVHDLHHGRVGPERVVKAGKFDANGTGADDQQLLGHAFGGQRRAIGPDQIAIGLKAGQLAGARTGGEDDGLGRQLFGAFVGFDADLALGGDCALAHDDGDLVLFHQMTDAAGQLSRHRAGAFDDSVQIIVDAIRFQAKFLGAVHQVKHFGRAQHRLGWDTAPVQADAAKIFTLDHGHAQAKLCGADRGHIAPGTRPNHHYVKRFRCHFRALADCRIKTSLPLNYFEQLLNDWRARHID